MNLLGKKTMLIKNYKRMTFSAYNTYYIFQVLYYLLAFCRPSHVGKALIDILSKAKSGSVWTVENGQQAKEYFS